MTTKKEELIKYTIIYNYYQQKWIVFREDYINYSLRPLYTAGTRKECTEWLRIYKEKQDTLKCCICKKEIKLTQSHNAEPYAHGRCCLKCNETYVIPARLLQWKFKEENNNEKKEEK